MAMGAHGTPHLYLVSQSPRRQKSLHQIGTRFALLLASNGEDVEGLEAKLPGGTPGDYVQRVYAPKAQVAVRRRITHNLPALSTLTSDATVCPGGEILGELTDIANTHHMLHDTSGHEYHVPTVVVIVKADGTPMHALSVPDMHFAVLAGDDIARYITSDEPFDKASAYDI